MKSDVSIWGVDNPKDLARHYAIRHSVFVNEQGVLVLTDVEERDASADVIHVLAARGDRCAGTVRLYPLDGDGRWKGDRLAVLKDYRTTVIGGQLVRFATATASARGGKVMEASVQLPNVKFFEKLGWVCDGDVRDFYGIPHQPMLFDLTVAPALDWPGRPASLETGLMDTPDTNLLAPAA